MSPRPRRANRLPSLPSLLARKLYKTGQTRGADDDVIYQNRVGRNSTVLIPYAFWDVCTAGHGGAAFERGFIALLSPSEYFGTAGITDDLAARGLAIGRNALVFYERRPDWVAHHPDTLGWTAATSRTDPLGGQYVARIPATTATTEGENIIRGFNATAMKGAGIRAYEYAGARTIKDCRDQLEALFWLCGDAEDVAASNGMSAEGVRARKEAILVSCDERGLLDKAKLIAARILNAQGRTICPFCLEELSSTSFFNRLKQAEGRLVPDLTVTEVNMFHIEELRITALNHQPYNLGWGHHHCNVVVKDSGIQKTLEWIREVLRRNVEAGHLPAENRVS